MPVAARPAATTSLIRLTLCSMPIRSEKSRVKSRSHQSGPARHLTFHFLVETLQKREALSLFAAKITNPSFWDRKRLLPASPTPANPPAINLIPFPFFSPQTSTTCLLRVPFPRASPPRPLAKTEIPEEAVEEILPVVLEVVNGESRLPSLVLMLLSRGVLQTCFRPAGIACRINKRFPQYRPCTSALL